MPRARRRGPERFGRSIDGKAADEGMTRRFHVAVVALVCGVFVAGCGGTTKSGVSGESGASKVRSGALAYVAVDSDLASSQWKQVDDLLEKFPGHDQWLRSLEREL